MSQPNGSASDCARQLKVLADEGRMLMIQLLQAGPLTVSDIATFLDLEIANASHHLRVLHRHRLVTTRRQGQHIYYSLSEDFFQPSRGKPRFNLGCCRLEMPDHPT